MMMAFSSSSSPNSNATGCYPAMVRSAKDGQWHLKQQHDSDASKLSPRKGGQLRDIEHSRPPYLGPDPHRPLIIKNSHNSSSSSSPSNNNNNNNNSASPSAGGFAGSSLAEVENNVDDSTSLQQQRRNRQNNNNDNNNNIIKKRSLSPQKGQSSSPARNNNNSKNSDHIKTSSKIKKDVSFETGLMNALNYQSISASSLQKLDSSSNHHDNNRQDRTLSLAESMVSIATNANDDNSPNFGRRVVPKSYANLDRETRKKLLGSNTSSNPANEDDDTGDDRNIVATPPPDVGHLSPGAARRTLNQFYEKQKEKIELERQRQELLQKKLQTTSRSRSDLEKDTLAPGIPIDASSTKKSISQFEEKLLRMELRTAEEMEDVSRPETPLMMMSSSTHITGTGGSNNIIASSSLSLSSAAAVAGFSASNNNISSGASSTNVLQQQQSRKFTRQQTFFANIDRARNHSITSNSKSGLLSPTPGENNNNNNNNAHLMIHNMNLPPPLVNVESPWMLNGSSRQALLNAQAGITGSAGGGVAHSLLLNQLHDFNNNTGKGGGPRPWETLDAKVRGKNPIFGILAGIPPHKLRPAFLKIERDFPTARTKGLDSKSFAKFLTVLTSSGNSNSNNSNNNPISENLVQQSMSYFECNFYIEQPASSPTSLFPMMPSSSSSSSPHHHHHHNNGDDFFSSPANRSPLVQPISIPSSGTASGSKGIPSVNLINMMGNNNNSNSSNNDDAVATNRREFSLNVELPTTTTTLTTYSSAPVVKRSVPFPQVVIRYGADFSPRYTDSAVVAVFAAMAGLSDSIQRLRPNSALLLSEVKSKPIREWAERTMTSNSAQRRRWIAICDALDNPEVKEEFDELVRDVVFIPPDLQRTEMEQRIFGSRMPNGAPLPPPPVMTLDQWRYVVYASEYLLPLVIALRNDVPHGDEDKNAIKKFEKVGGAF